MQRWFALAMSVVAGCSWIYNPDGLPPAPHDAEIVVDVDPTMPALDDVSPQAIYEGQGDGGSQPALLVIHGQNLADNQTTVQVTTAMRAVKLDVGAPVVATNGKWIAVTVTAHVDPTLSKADRVSLVIHVTQAIPAALDGGMATAELTGKLELVGLDELTKASPAVTGATISTALLEPQYSKVDLTGAAYAFTGARRAIVHAVSSIATGKLSAVGAPGSNGTAAAAVGGCAGGSPGSDGGCDGLIGGGHGQAAGGLGLGNGGGGGGGGFASEGSPAGGAGAGIGGARTGDELIVTYDGAPGRAANRAGGGGGGGMGLLGTVGGGGGGGGSIEVTAGGNVTVADIDVTGGAGLAGTASSGGGGGGAGGLVMLRAEGALVTGTLIAAGGAGGGSGSGGSGGAGSAGRVRWDAQSNVAPTVPAGTRHRGPVFTVETRLFRTPKVTLTLVGTANDRFDVYTSHAALTMPGPQGVSFDAGGAATFALTLAQGATHVCLTLQGGQQGSSEADKCIDVAFLP